MLLWLLACSSPAPLDVADAFELPVGDPERVRFIALGDTGKGNQTQRDVAEGIRTVCAHRRCDFVLLLGDNLYNDGMVTPDDPRMDEVFTDIYSGLDLPFAAVLGNHDWGRYHYADNARYQLEWAAKNDQYVLPAPNYRFQAGHAELWAIDTDTVFWEGKQPVAGWLDRTLQGSEARWKVVFGHHTYRSEGPHGNAGAYEGWQRVPYVSGGALRELFDDHVKGQADLYVCGHDHSLQTFDHEGLELVVSGSGASTTPLVDRGNHPDLAFSKPGFVWVELGETMSFEVYDAAGQLLGRR